MPVACRLTLAVAGRPIAFCEMGIMLPSSTPVVAAEATSREGQEARETAA